MTKAELLKALEPFSDDQFCFIALADGPGEMYQISIQVVKPIEPWHDGLPDKSNWLVGIVGHRQNRVLIEYKEQPKSKGPIQCV